MSFFPEGQPIDHITQAFPRSDVPYETSGEPAVARLLQSWAATLPYSPLGIIDLAAGRGDDVFPLMASGYRVIAQDSSPVMVADSIVQGVARIGDATGLPYPDGSFGGAILKDALIYLSFWQRQRMFWEVYRTLVDRGQLWILSEESGWNRAYYTRNSVNLWDEISCIDQDPSETSDEWLQRIENHRAMGTRFVDVHYAVHVDEVIFQAQEAGLRVIQRKRYPKGNPVAKENRWRQNRLAYDLMVFEKV